MDAMKMLVHDIVDAFKHWLYIYDYQLAIADLSTGYEYFCYTRFFSKPSKPIREIGGTTSMSELKLKCAIAGIDFDKQVDLWDLRQNRFCAVNELIGLDV